jgi:hypothetical protein
MKSLEDTVVRVVSEVPQQTCDRILEQIAVNGAVPMTRDQIQQKWFQKFERFLFHFRVAHLERKRQKDRN